MPGEESASSFPVVTHRSEIREEWRDAFAIPTILFRFPVKTEEQSKPNSPAEQPPRPESVPLREEEKPPTNNTVSRYYGRALEFGVTSIR